jgi:hypothetical protein
MAKLKFLDAKPIDKREKLSALQASSVSNCHDVHHLSSENSPTRMETFSSIKKFFGFSTRENPPSGSSDKQSIYSPLPSDNLDTWKSPKSAYGKVKSSYEGSQSQGNRFILNQDL